MLWMVWASEAACFLTHRHPLWGHTAPPSAPPRAAWFWRTLTRGSARPAAAAASARTRPARCATRSTSSRCRWGSARALLNGEISPGPYPEIFRGARGCTIVRSLSHHVGSPRMTARRAAPRRAVPGRRSPRCGAWSLNTVPNARRPARAPPPQSGPEGYAMLQGLRSLGLKEAGASSLKGLMETIVTGEGPRNPGRRRVYTCIARRELRSAATRATPLCVLPC